MVLYFIVDFIKDSRNKAKLENMNLDELSETATEVETSSEKSTLDGESE